MATPIISILRRNQGYVLAAMGVVLIITWVIGPVALEYFTGGSRGSQPPPPVVVQWKKGNTQQNLSEADLAHLRQEHIAVLEFVRSVVQKAVEKDFIPQAPGLNLTPNPRTGRTSLGLSMDISEAAVFNLLLFAERGREMGVRVDKDAMVAYLKNLSGHGMEEGDFLALAKEIVEEKARGGGVLSVDSLFAALRRELTAQQAQYMIFAGVFNVSTGELWDYHKQLNLRYKIEAYPIDVVKLKSNFNASDAKAEELIALFNKGKDQVFNPDFPEPGFKVPHRIAFGYCTVDFDVFLAIAKKNVPEAAAVERYKKGIAQGEYRKPVKPKLPSSEKPPETAPEPKPAEEEKKPAETEKKEETENPKSSEEKPPLKPADKEASPAAEKPAGEPAKCEDEPATDAKPGEEKDLPKEETKPEPAKPEPAKPEPTKPEPAKPEPEVPSPATTDPGKTTPEKTTPGKTDPGNIPEATKSAGEKKDNSGIPEPVEEIEHRTYEEVRDQILTELAQPEATQLRDDAVQSAMDELRDYATNLKRYAESIQEKNEAKVENPGDFRPLAFAKKYKFKYDKTKLVDQFESANTELGKNALLPQGQQGSIPFSQFAFYLNANLYDPQKASSFGETEYLYWRIENQPERAVELENDGSLPPAIKAEVEEAWRKEKAFEAAKKQAQELADKAKGAALREIVGKAEVGKIVQPVPFSMYTSNGFLAFGGRPEFSQPSGIPLAGKEFMDAVFSLKPGEAGIAVDQPHNVVYAVHILADEPSLEIRREMFLNALQRGQFSDLMAFAAIEKGRDNQALFDDLEKHFGVKWIRPPSFGGGGDE